VTFVAIILAGVIVAELVALIGRRNWVHWKLGRRQALVDDAISALADALVAHGDVEPPQGRVNRRAFRLAALELFPVLVGSSRKRLTRLAESTGLVGDVIRTLQRSPRAYARRTAADELAEIRSAQAAPALTASLGDVDPVVRVACVRGLALLGDLTEISRMLEVLDGDSLRAPSEAQSAMLALARTAPESLVELEQSGSSRFARRLAALALATVGDKRAIPSVLGELAENNVLLSSVAVRAIEQVGGDDAIASLEHVLDDGTQDASLREQAARALERVR
jgi:HEAT repeat protein